MGKLHRPLSVPARLQGRLMGYDKGQGVNVTQPNGTTGVGVGVEGHG